MAYSSITVRVDADVKERANALFQNLGLNMSTAVKAFLYASLRHNGMPFEVVNTSKMDQLDQLGEEIKTHTLQIDKT